MLAACDAPGVSGCLAKKPPDIPRCLQPALVADKSLQRVIQHPNVGVVRAVKARLARDEIDMVHGRVQQAAGALVFKNRPGGKSRWLVAAEVDGVRGALKQSG